MRFFESGMGIDGGAYGLDGLAALDGTGVALVGGTVSAGKHGGGSKSWEGESSNGGESHVDRRFCRSRTV